MLNEARRRVERSETHHLRGFVMGFAIWSEEEITALSNSVIQ
jgi:hypothetical protein